MKIPLIVGIVLAFRLLLFITITYFVVIHNVTPWFYLAMILSPFLDNDKLKQLK